MAQDPEDDRPAPTLTHAAGSLDRTAAELDGAPPAAPCDLETVDSARYEVRHEHGRGGLGRILAARDRRLDRPVALKELLQPGAQTEARFVREALVTARLQHPAIVPVYDAGRWPSGEPFYAMKLVSGLSLRELIRGKPTLAERLALLPNVIAAAEAVAYAHHERVLHRDLKPANVLVGPFGETLVIDWGLAKDLRETTPEEEQPGLTVRGAVMGTAGYMAPEQALGGALDERVDVYALGTILYEVLCGTAPYEGTDAMSVVRAVRAGPPPALESRVAGVPPDLLAIVRKAMARRPSERYRTAGELVQDLRRFEAGQLVGVHVYGPVALARRFVRRHRSAVAVAAIAIVALLALGTAAVSRVVRERAVALRERAAALSRTWELMRLQARSELDRDPTASLSLLASYPVEAPRWDEVQQIVAEAVERGIARRHLSAQDPLFAFAPDGRRLAAFESVARVSLWDPASGRQLASQPTPASFLGAEALAVAPDGVTIAAGDAGGTLTLWNSASGAVRRVDAHQGGLFAVAFSPDGRLLGTGGADRAARLWDVAAGPAAAVTIEHDEIVVGVAFAPDSRRFASLGRDGAVRVHDLEAHDTVTLRAAGDERPFLEVPGTSRKLLFSPDGRYLVKASHLDLVVWERPAWRPRVLRGHRATVLALAASPAGQLASASFDGEVHLWSLADGTGRLVESLDAPAWDVAFSGDGSRLAIGSTGATRLVDLGTGESETLLQPAVVSELAFAPDDATLAAGGTDGIRIWPVRPGRGRVERGLDAPPLVAFGPDGTFAWTAARPSIRIEARAGSRTLTTEAPLIGLALDGASRLVAVDATGRLRAWSRPWGEGEVRTVARLAGTPRALTLTADGTQALVGTAEGAVTLTRLDDGLTRPVAQDAGSVSWADTAPEGGLLAAWGSRLLLVDPNAGVRHELDLGGPPSSRFAFGPGENRVVWIDKDTRVALLDLASGDRRSLPVPSPATAVAATATGLVATGHGDGTVRVWKDDGATLVRSFSGHSQGVSALSFSPDGHRLASWSYDASVRVWTVETGAVLVARRDASVGRFAPDGRLFTTTGDRAGFWFGALDPEGSVPADPEVLRAWIAERLGPAGGT